MSPHAVPSVAQRRHWYEYDVGAPLHVPFEAVSVSPSFAVPLICGSAVFWGVAAERANATVPATPQATTMTASGTSRRRTILCLRMGFSFVGFIPYGCPLWLVFSAANGPRLRSAYEPLIFMFLARLGNVATRVIILVALLALVAGCGGG